MTNWLIPIAIGVLIGVAFALFGGLGDDGEGPHSQ